MVYGNSLQAGRLLVLVAATAGLVAGCAADADLGYTVRTLPLASDDQAIAAAEQAFREHFRIARTSSSAEILVELKAEPAERLQRGGTGRLRDGMVAVPTRVRRVGVLRLARQGEQLRALCQVLQQRLDTSDLEMFRRDQQRDDFPTDTPIDRDAVTAEQNAVWTDMGRDLALEREILASLIERLAPAAEAAAPPG